MFAACLDRRYWPRGTLVKRLADYASEPFRYANCVHCEDTEALLYLSSGPSLPLQAESPRPSSPPRVHPAASNTSASNTSAAVVAAAPAACATAAKPQGPSTASATGA